MPKFDSNEYKRQDYHIYQSAKKLHLYILKFVSHKIPKTYANIRICLTDECSLLIRNIYNAYYNEGNIRKKSVNDACTSISLVNHYLELLHELDVFNVSNISAISNLLSDVKISLFAWRSKLNAEK